VTFPVKQLGKFILILIAINILSAVTGYLINRLTGIGLPLPDIYILSASFSLICTITMVIFLRGQTREPDSQTLHTLAAVSLKLLLDMILALIWFFVSKKSSLTSVFIFFVIYLTLTLFSVFVILKILKNRSL
jgi:hypothetical protein